VSQSTNPSTCDVSQVTKFTTHKK